MRSLRTLSLCAVAGAFFSSTALFAQHVGPTVRITGPISTSQVVTLKGTVPFLANAHNDRGLAPAGMQLERMHLILKRSPAQEAALRQLIAEQNTPGSPNYHKWLTPAQFGAEFGPSQQDIATLEKWLTSQGFQILKLEPGNQTLDISGTVGQLSSAFHTQIHKYMVNGRLHYSNANNPQIPAALSPVVGGFVSLNNFHYRSQAVNLGEATYNPATGLAKPSWTVGSGSFNYQNYNFVLSPVDFATEYNLAPLYQEGLNGTGQTIAIVNDSNINLSLVNQFRSLFNLPYNPPQVIIDGNDPGINGINNPDGPNYDSVEAYLDVEWAGAIAPNATIDLVIAADTAAENGLMLAAEHAVYSDIAPVISVSFGQCESILGSNNGFVNSLWQQAAAQGQTVMVAAGDNGSAGCDDQNTVEYASGGQAVNGLASTPYDVAVGGTDFFYSSYNSGSSAINSQLQTYWDTTASNSTPTASIKGYIPEQPWNNSQYGLNLFSYYSATGSTTITAGSGGASNAALCSNNSYSSTTGQCTGTTSGYSKPAWQQALVGLSGFNMPNDKVRDLPDVSLFAASGYNDSFIPICATDGDCQPVSSGSTVQVFGVGGTSAAAPAFAAIMALVNQKYGPQGQADTILYPLAVQDPTAFNAVTHGTNTVPCEYSPTLSTNCIQGTNPLTVQITNSSGVSSSVTEGEIGTGSTADYNAAAGYNLATGLGSINAYNLVTDWGNVKLPSTTVTLNPTTSTSFTHGDTFSFNGTVTGTGSGTPTGDVAIMTNSTEQSQQGITTFPLGSSGNYSGSLTTLPGGNYDIWASYSGDSNNAMSVSQKIPLTVQPEPSGIAFGIYQNTSINAPGSGSYLTTSPSASIDYGTQLMLSAKVAPTADVTAVQNCSASTSTAKCPTYGAPTGVITFLDNGATLNTAVLNSEGDAEFNAPLSVGSHSLSASYAGDNSYDKSTSANPITVTVAKDTPVISLGTSVTGTGSSGTTSLVNGPNQPTVLTVEVENGAQCNAVQCTSSTSTSAPSAIYPAPVAAPTGTVTLTSSLAGLSGTQTLQPFVDPATGAIAGVATYTLPANTSVSTVNSYTLAVAYSGDSNYNALSSSSNSYSLPFVSTSGSGVTTTIAATMTGSISPDSTITISGTVTGQSGSSAPTGTIYVYSSGNYPAQTGFYSSSGDVSSFAITLNSQTLFQGSNYISLEYLPSSSSSYNPSELVLTKLISNPLSDFNMVPEQTIVPVTAGGSSGTATVNLTSTNGFTGNVSLFCTATPGVDCSVSPSSVSLTNGGSASTTLTITAPADTANATYSVAVVGQDSTGEYIHTAGVQAAVTGSSVGASSYALSANPGVLAFTPGATTGNTTTIAVTPLGAAGFTGTVDLSCNVTPAGSNSPTCSIAPSTVNVSGTVAQTPTLTVTSSASTTPGTYTVNVQGTSGSIAMNTAVTVNVGNFTLTPNPASLTLSAGATSGNTSAITIAPQAAFDGNVYLSCKVTTSISNPGSLPSCSVPASVMLNGTGSQTATVTVSTTASATSAMNDQKKPFWPAAGGGAMLAAVLFFWVPKKRRSWLAMIVLMVGLVSMAGMGCGGGLGSGGSGGSGGGGTSPGGPGNTSSLTGTSSGAYTVTVTGTSGSLTQTATVTLNVN